MPIAQVKVGPQTPKDGQPFDARGDAWGAVGSSSMNGFFAEQVARGNGYSFTTALAGNALVAATTTNAPAIWNPPSSGRVLLVQCVKFGRTAKGTPLEGSVVYHRQTSVQGLGTGADIISGTSVAAVNLRSDLPDNSKMLFFPTTSARRSRRPCGRRPASRRRPTTARRRSAARAPTAASWTGCTA
jgi:hypothetical protein